VYDLDLSNSNIDILKTIHNLHILPLHTNRPYFELGAKVWKPLAILKFIDAYSYNHTCKSVFYGDSSIHFKKSFHEFDESVWIELQTRGIVAENETWFQQEWQTHPLMYDFFQANYTQLSLEQFRQIQSGLMLIDVTNTTMRKLFFKKWANCAANIDCLSPNNTATMPGFSFSNKLYHYDNSTGQKLLFQ
jgi:hypothetical protein